MLHIFNGDSAAGTAKQSGIPGHIVAWREALVCGPTPGGVSDAEFRQLRARYLAETYGAPLEQCEKGLRRQEQSLAAYAKHDEVVLWFEHDLFCQVQLIYLLHWFAQRELGNTKLSLICIDEFPGVPGFRGLGELNESQLASLFPLREEISTDQLQLGAKAWLAYSAREANGLLALIDSDLSALPFLPIALSKHLQRFPSTKNGLGRIGNVGLELIASGQRKFTSLFPAFASREPEYGFGDAQFFLELKRLAGVAKPLLRVNGNGSAMESAQMLLSSFEITEHGQAVLSGTEDFVHSDGIDQWLGGIHLEGNEVRWRWDEQEQKLLTKM
jgi:hypothetical protein